jgi:acyl-CoA thioesterase I
VTERIAAVFPLLIAATFAAQCGDDVGRILRPSGRILVVGDSLSVSPSDSNNFPAILESRLKTAGLSWRVINEGIRGDTTAGGLSRIDGLLAANRPDVLILALGANDGLRGLDIGQMSRNLTGMIARAKTDKVEVLLCGMQLPPLNMLSYGRQYRNAFEEIADAEDVAFVPFLLEGVAMDRKLNGGDGIHPNADGAKRIAETIWPHLQALLKSLD